MMLSSRMKLQIIELISKLFVIIFFQQELSHDGYPKANAFDPSAQIASKRNAIRF